MRKKNRRVCKRNIDLKILEAILICVILSSTLYLFGNQDDSLLSHGSSSIIEDLLTGAAVENSEISQITIPELGIQATTCSNCAGCDTAVDSEGVVLLDTDILNEASECINIGSSNVEFDCQGYTIDGTLTLEALDLGNNVSNITIRNCNITDWYVGIEADDVNNNELYIINNSFIENNNAIYLTNNSGDVKINYNTFNQISNTSIIMFNVNNVNISYNNINSSGYGINIVGVNNSYFTYNNLNYTIFDSEEGVGTAIFGDDINNSVFSKNYFTGSENGDFQLTNAFDNNFTHNIIFETSGGTNMQVSGAEDYFYNNTISEGGSPALITMGYNMTVVDNYIHDQAIGIMVSGQGFNVTGNRVIEVERGDFGNFGSITIGYQLGFNESVVEDNNLTGGVTGLVCEDCENVNISNNYVFNMTDYSAYLFTDCANITLSDNELLGNVSIVDSTDSWFINNNITDCTSCIDDNSTGVNYLVYNNSFGQIKWSKNNITTNIELVVNETIFLQNNTVGLTNDPQALMLNNPAEIEIRNISYSIAPFLFNDNVRCDNSDTCNVSYSSMEEIMYANISSFSNYTTNVTCLDNDSDGFGVCPNCNVSNGCTYDYEDCDDTDGNVFPPGISLSVGGVTSICSGTYNFSLNPAEHILAVSSDNSSIICNSTTILGNNSGIGVTIQGYENVSVVNCTFNNLTNGLDIKSSRELVIFNNTFYGDLTSINIDDANESSFRNNTFSNTLINGIAFNGGFGAFVNNNITHNYFTISNGNSIVLSYPITDTIINGNTFNDLSASPIFLTGSPTDDDNVVVNNNQISSVTDSTGFKFKNLTGSNITNNDIDDVRNECFRFEQMFNDNLIQGNNLTNCGEDGINISADVSINTLNNTINNNIIETYGSNSENGINLDTSDDYFNFNYVISNNLISNTVGNGSGIFAPNMNNSNFTNNNLTNFASQGINLSSGDNLLFEGNLIFNTSNTGLNINGGTNLNITGNNISSCGVLSNQFTSSWSPRLYDGIFYGTDNDEPQIYYTNVIGNVLIIQVSNSAVAGVNGLENYSMCLTYDTNNGTNNTWFVQNWNGASGYTDCANFVQQANSVYPVNHVLVYEERDVLIAEGATSNYTMNFNSNTSIPAGLFDDPHYLSYEINLIPGISFGENSSENLIYNNFFNNSVNSYDLSSGNNYNVSKQTGTNIIGGNWIAGNYWDNYLGADGNYDGIGDILIPYNGSENIVSGGDYLPLTALGDFVAPTVTLSSPADNYFNDSVTELNVTFECNATDITQLSNISFYISNSTNQSFSLNQTTEVFGTINNTNWTLELGVGNYTWNCLANDNVSNSAFAESNRTLLMNYTAVCGNGVKEGAEGCDTNDYDGLTCVDYGFISGSLSCNNSCSISTSSCSNGGSSSSPSSGSSGGGVGGRSYDCDDNRDNDGDGLNDYPNDPGCSSERDDNETDPYVPPVETNLEEFELDQEEPEDLLSESQETEVKVNVPMVPRWIEDKFEPQSWFIKVAPFLLFVIGALLAIFLRGVIYYNSALGKKLKVEKEINKNLKQLEDFIKSQRNFGVEDQKIRKDLVDIGWKKEIVSKYLSKNYSLKK